MKHAEPERFRIDRYLAGELDETEARSIKKHLEDCEICSEYYQEKKREDEEFLRRYPFSSFKDANLTTEHSSFRPVSQSLNRPLLVPAFVFLLLIVVIAPFMALKQRNGNDQVTFKGKQVLSFVCKREGNIQKGNLSQTYHCDDQIQIIYNSSKEQFITLFSIDSKKEVSFYHPDQQSNDCSIATGIGSNITYPGSIVLDSVSGYELIVAVFSKKPLRVSQIEKWIKGLINNKKSIHELQQLLEKAPLSHSTFVATLLLKKG